MGFSVSSSFIIIVIALMLGTGLFISTAGNTFEELADAGSQSLTTETDRLRTDIEITEAVYHYDGTRLDITVENTGSRSIAISNTDVILDGEYYAVDTFTVATVKGDPSSDVVHPGETLTLVRDPGKRFDRVKVVTEYGVTAYSDVRVVQDATILEPNPPEAHVVSTHNSSIVAVGDTVGNTLDSYTLDYSTAPGMDLSVITASDIDAEAEGTALTVDSVTNPSPGELQVNFDGSYTVGLGDKILVNVSNVRNPNASGNYDVPITIGDGSNTETDTANLAITSASKAMLVPDDAAIGATTGHDAYFVVESGDSMVGRQYSEFEIDYDTSSGVDVSSVQSSDVTIEIDRDGDGAVDITQTDPTIDTSTNPLTVTFDGSPPPDIEAGDVVRVRVAANVVNPTIPGNYTVPLTVYSEPQGGGSQTTTTADAYLMIPGTRPWPMFSFDEPNTGHRTDLFGPVKDIALRWSVTTDGEVRSSPAIKDDYAYFGSHDGNVYAYDATEGTQEWRFVVDAKVFSSPAVHDETVYVGANDGTVYALDRETGTQQWTFSTGGKVHASPTVVDETVFVGSLDNSVYAINASDGSERWSFSTNGEIHTTPAVANGSVFFASKGEKTVYAVNRSTGSKDWERNVGEVLGGVVASDGVVFAGDQNGDVHALDAGDGSTVWTENTGAAIDSSPAVSGDSLYIGDAGGNGVALWTANGTERWSVFAGAELHSSPAVVSDTLYAGSTDGSVYALDTADGAIRWSYATGGEIHSSPAVTNGVVYIGSDDGSMYALQGPEPLFFEWRVAGDWDTTTDDFGVVHEADANTDWPTDAIALGYPSTDQTGSALAGYWPLDEDSGSTAHDLSGNGRDGTLQGPTVGTNGLWNRTAYDFQEVDANNGDYVDLGTSNLGVSGEGMAISVWFRADDYPNDARMISKATGSSASEHWWMLSENEVDDDNRLRFRLKTDPDESSPSTTTLNAWSGNLPTGTWVHAVAVYDGSEMRLYQDGSLVGSTSKTGTIVQNDTVPTYIGMNPDTGSAEGYSPFDGDIDEVRLYNRSLTASEVEKLHEVGRNGTSRNGHLVTGWQQHTATADVSALQVRNVHADLPSGTEITVYVETDTDDDGNYEERSDAISLDGSGGPYAVTGLSTDTDTVRLRMELETNDPTLSPRLHAIEIKET